MPVPVEMDARLTPVRSVAFGAPDDGAVLSMTRVEVLTWLAGPQFPTASTTVFAFTPSTTVPALQPVTTIVQVVPEPVGAPTEQPVAVPPRPMSRADNHLTGPPKRRV